MIGLFGIHHPNYRMYEPLHDLWCAYAHSVLGDRIEFVRAWFDFVDPLSSFAPWCRRWTCMERF